MGNLVQGRRGVKKRWPLGLLLLVLSPAAWAEETPSGVVRLEQLRRGAAGSAGDLNMPARPLIDVGELALLAAQGDPAQQRTPSAPQAEEEGEELAEVEVTGTRRTRPQRRETVTRYEIKKEQIEASGAVTISDALTKLSPGFFATNSLGGIDTERGTFLRGLDSRRFLVLVDGRPTTRPGNNRSIDLGRVGVTNIERIEVITGGAGLLYSADAVGGAINIITRVPQGPARVRLRSEQGSYGFSRYTFNLTGSNELAPTTAGFFGYEFNYERRSAYNNYFGTYYQEPVGEGIALQGTGVEALVPPDAPSTPTSAAALNNVLYQIPISFSKPFRSGYTFNDDFLAKFVYQPGSDHTLTLTFLKLSSRTGDQFAAPNLVPRCRIVPENYGISLELFDGGRLLPPIDPFSDNPERRTYTRCDVNVTPTPADQALSGRGDQALDEFTAALNYDWKPSPSSRLNLQGSWASSFADNPSSPGTRLVSANLVDAQLRYTLDVSPANTFNTGLQYNYARYTATPVVGAGGNQQPLTSFNRFFQPLPQPVVSPYFAVDFYKNSWSAYLTDQWRFFDEAVVLDLGTRITTDDFFGTFTTPGAGLRWNIGPKEQEILALRASWFESFKAPGLSQLFGYGGYSFTQVSDLGGQVDYVRNQLLRPETGVSYDFGFDLNLGPSAQFRLTYYRTQLTNGIVENVPISLQPLQISTLEGVIDNPAYANFTPEQLAQLQFTPCFGVGSIPATVNGVPACQNLITNVNAQSYLSTGWDFSFNWQVTPQFEIFASHSIVDARPVGNPVLNTFPDITTGLNLPLGSGGIQGGYFYNYQSLDVPFNTTNVLLRYNSPGGFRVALTGQFVGLRPRPDGGPHYYLPYNRWDLTFGVPLVPGLTLTGGVFNLFNDRSILADGTLAIGGGVLSPPTTFRAGVEVVF
ncbi:TonB-dependent receptor plug domain-containing protein [Gloeobacter kilaueensis]|uniref:TonB-dependent receptor n=1 Tax=Gloeobacter kilaueensis (strain ATCC BAA-2537 / CCAP 1431/1 / ULC 316 / JS1) TaxID=1183438 RepID=U5QD51_GLOK1|nr:TonB-dependent receptor [Gloeobacter kilaueensis]AGY56796.1 TonB-dependent receptor [Gloeobacter kilaueensis JS1]